MVAASGSQDATLLALYQDTQGCTIVVVDGTGRPLGRSYGMLTQHRPQPGWAEYDAYEIWHRAWQGLEQASKAAGISLERMAALGVTTHPGTVVAWERASGQPLSPAIAAHCLRTSWVCERLRAAGHQDLFRQHTGGMPDETSAGLKIHWLLENIPDLRARAERGEVCCGTLDSWLLWNLTEGKVYATDLTHASSTRLLNLGEGDWDEDVLHLLNIPRAALPDVHASSYPYGALRGKPLPIAALCADQQASLFGQACFEPGVAKVTYGRQANVMVECGEKPVDSAGQLRTGAAPRRESEAPAYVLEGTVLSAGTVVEWLRDDLALIPTASDSEMMALQGRGDEELYLIPSFAGLGAPYWRPDVRGDLSGLNVGTSRGQIVRAALEGIAYRVRDILDTMAHWTGNGISQVRADGGAAANNYILQFESNLLGVPVCRNRLTHAAPTGVAQQAGLQIGLWRSREEIGAQWTEERRFEPGIDEHSRRQLYQGWQEAVRRLIGE